MIIYIDIETRSTVDLNSAGSYRLIRDPSTVILCVSYSVDGAPPSLWWAGQPLPSCFLSETATYVSHNNQFDRVCFDHHIRQTRVDQWDDTMVRCLYYGLPPALDDVCLALFDLRKDPRGKELVESVSGKGVCRPQRRQRKGHPAEEYWNNKEEDLRALGEYCVQDCALLIRLSTSIPPLPPVERAAWHMYERMNDNGVCVDVGLATGAVSIMAERQVTAEARLTNVTHGEITSSGQIKRIAEFVNREMGGPSAPKLANCQADTITEFLGRNKTPDNVRAVLETRQSSNSAAVKKYHAAIARVCEDGRVHGSMYFYGAHTGRSSSRGLQLQNAKRGKEKNYLGYCEAAARQDFGRYDGWVDWNYHLSYGVRRLFVAEPGNTFVVEDYKGIEARTVDWLVGDEEGLERARNDVDGYKILASRIFGVGVENITDHQRNVGKESRLSGQYGIGHKGYRRRLLKTWGIDQSEEESRLSIKVFRAEHWIIVEAWKELERAWRSACAGMPAFACKCTFSVENGWMRITGPDGRSLYYYSPSSDMSYGVVGSVTKDKETGKEKPLRKKVYGGYLLENIAQWIAGVITRDDMVEIEKARLSKFCFMVHDEHISEVRLDRAIEVQKHIEAVMRKPKWWCPSLPIDVEGWIGPHYKKG